MNWDTMGLHGEACRQFELSRSLHNQGRDMLDEIAVIGEHLDKLGKIEHLKVSSHNDCSFSPNIEPSVLKSFVEKTLEERRDDLRKKFNRLFKEPKQ